MRWEMLLQENNHHTTLSSVFIFYMNHLEIIPGLNSITSRTLLFP